MNKIIHIIITGFFKLFVPFIYLSFIIAGIFSALVSAIIEYDVFSELFIKSDFNNSSILLSVPLLVVVSFEVTKIFLIFLNKQYSISDNSHYQKDKSSFLRLRYILIFISFFATLIYSFYNLQNPEFENNLKKEYAELKSQYDIDVKIIETTFDNNIKSQTQNIDNQIAIFDSRMTTEENYKFKGRQEYRGPRFEQAEKSKKEQEDKREIITNNLNTQKLSTISNRTQKLEDDKIKVKDKINKSSSSGNKMLTATLSILNTNSNYSEGQYIFLVGLLSLLLSVGLEFIIWSSFTVLAINHGDIFDFGIQTEKYKNATQAELEINKTDFKKEVKNNTNYATQILYAVSNSAKDLIKRAKKDF
ncbi:MAG: hypothetical protein GQ564_09125 [Bacteroidales bacterium]|nr:hypothetical protein [Bacteroidales bacterium]